MIYAALWVNLFMQADPLLGQMGGVGPWKSRVFGPKWHSHIALMPFHKAQKLSISKAQPLPTCPRNVSARIKNITHGENQINHRCINSYNGLAH